VKIEDREPRTENREPKAEIRKRLIFFLSVLVFCGGCGQPVYKDFDLIMGSFVEVVSQDPRAKDIVFQEFRRLEKIFNLFDAQSELSRLNATGDLVVSDDLFRILAVAGKFFEMTDGAFDVTVAPVSLLWKDAIKSGQMPSPESIKAGLSEVGFGNVFLNGATRQVKFLTFGTRIDLGGMAKGYAVDRAVAKLKGAGVTCALVNAGGNLYAWGGFRGKPWQVGIQDPRNPRRLVEKIEIRDKGVATSGDYEQFFVFQNRRYSHIINPKSGAPADSGLVSATVVADDALTADVLSTSLIVMGREKGASLLARFPGVHAKVIDERGKIFTI
jgi:thiamine biosynthesis lipoprotein